MSFFYEIYKAAKSKNKTEIEKILGRGGCIDEWQKGSDRWTVASQLASEGDVESAEWLRVYCGANANFIVLGAALGAALVAARGGVNLLLNEYIKFLLNECSVDGNYVARGFAQGGDQATAETYSNDGDSIGLGAVQCSGENWRDYVENLRTKYKDAVHKIAFGAALVGKEEYAEFLRNKHGAKVNFIAEGAGQGGFERYARQLLTTHNASAGCIIRGAILGGQEKFAKTLLDEFGSATPIKLGLGDAVRDGYNPYIEQLYLRYGISPTLGNEAIKAITTRCEALRLLSCFSTDKIRQLFGKQLMESKINFVNGKLIQEAKKINALMKITWLGYQQIYDWADSSDLRNWIFVNQSYLLNGKYKIPPEIHAKIASFFTRGSESTTHEMHEKMVFWQYKKLLLGGLTKFQPSFFKFFLQSAFDKYEKLQKLKERVKESHTVEEVIKLLKDEKASIGRQCDAEYMQFLKRNLRRYRQLENPNQPIKGEVETQNTI